MTSVYRSMYKEGSCKSQKINKHASQLLLFFGAHFVVFLLFCLFVLFFFVCVFLRSGVFQPHKEAPSSITDRKLEKFWLYFVEPRPSGFPFLTPLMQLEHRQILDLTGGVIPESTSFFFFLGGGCSKCTSKTLLGCFLVEAHQTDCWVLLRSLSEFPGSEKQSKT